MDKDLIRKMLNDEKEENSELSGFESPYMSDSDDEEEEKILTSQLQSKYADENIKILGKGSYGIVYLTTKGNMQYVVKELSIQSDRSQTLIKREIDILEKIQPRCKPYLVCLEGWKIKTVKVGDVTNKYVLLAFEYIPNSIQLYKAIKTLDYTASQKKKLIKNMILGLAELHSIGIAHRDIKPENILVDTQINARYIDFGLSCEKTDDACYKTYVGTISYTAPELYLSKPDKYIWEMILAADIWALGLTILDLNFYPDSNKLLSKLDDYYDNDKVILEKISKTINNFFDQFGSYYEESKIFIPMIKSMLTTNWLERPTAEFIKKQMDKR